MTALPFPVPRQLFPVEHLFLDLDGARIHAGERIAEAFKAFDKNPAG